MRNFPRFDDVGAFPLAENIPKEKFEQFYWIAYKALINQKEEYLIEHSGINQYFFQPIATAVNFKIKSGLEVVNYPQFMDMIDQFLKPIADYEIAPNLIAPKKASIPEMLVLEKVAKEKYNETGNPLEAKICVTGPIELYIKKHNFTVYYDLALNFAKSINSFIKNSLVNTKYMKTTVISIDEPSFGYVDLFNVSNDDIIKIFDKTLEGINATNQIHLHSLNQASVPLRTKNIDVLTCEYASDHTNKIPKKQLEKHDKFIRVGITRTNIDNIIGEKIESGMRWDEIKTYKGMLTLIDPKEKIKKNLLSALYLYDERLKFIGPDCGLKGWRNPEVAYQLLSQTQEVIEDVKKTYK
jgi:5-methyltetrahydropteroyltriglutamate--homocysteine methyltransferase